MNTPTLIERFLARVIDSIIISVAGVVLGRFMHFGPGWLISHAAITWLYFSLFDMQVGATPGKKLLGMRVVGPSGEKPTAQQAFIREAFTVVGAVPFAGPVLALIAWIWIAVSINGSSSGQGVHDQWAGGTRVAKG